MLYQIRQYGRYLYRAKTKHGVHSPFVFELITRVYEDKQAYPEYASIEQLRRRVLKDSSSISLVDFGAGSGNKGEIGEKTYTRSVSSIARMVAKPARWGQFLFRLCRYYQPQTILELGTSLGLSAAYQMAGALKANQDASQHRRASLITLEGSPALAELAKRNFEQLALNKTIKVVTGNFDDTLPHVLQEVDRLDFVFVDGNHRKAPTLNYFELLLAKAHNDTIFVFDDIHWSKEMTEAWEEIKVHARVRVTIDFYFLGLVFIRSEQVKEDFIIR